MQENRRDSAYKEYIEVIAAHRFDGSLQPIKFKAEAFPAMRIDRVLDVRRGASIKAGGHGMRYRCRVGDKEITLWHDGQFWFLEMDDYAEIYADADMEG